MKVKYRKRALLFTSLLVAALVFALVPAGLPVFADPGSWTQTLDADFNAGTKTQVAVASDSVKLATQANTITLTPTADAWVRNESGYTGTNYGSDTQLRIMAATRWALVKFDVSTATIPAGATITSARMRIYVSADGTYVGGGTADAHRITSSWTESGVTWTSRPAYSATATSNISVTGTGWTPYWDVKSDVLAFRAGTYTNYGWWLKDHNESFGYGCYFRCWSRNYATDTTLWPQLEVTYSSAAYYTSGNLVSSKYDTGEASNFGTIAFTIDKPANTDLKFQIRTADTEAGLDAATWYGPTGTGDYYTTSGTSINAVHNGGRWVQYKAYFSTTDTTKTPRLDDITINYSAAVVPPTIEITAPAGISGWALSPSGTQPKTTTGTLYVTTTNADGKSWSVAVSDGDTTNTNGYMTKWTGSAYDTGTKLGTAMQVQGSAGTVTLPGGGNVVTGSGTVTNAEYTITFEQTVLWTDQVLTGGAVYKIVVTFTATITP